MSINKRALFIRMIAGREELKRIANERKCKNPKYSICADPRDRRKLIIIPYSSVVCIIGFETRKEAERLSCGEYGVVQSCLRHQPIRTMKTFYYIAALLLLGIAAFILIHLVLIYMSRIAGLHFNAISNAIAGGAIGYLGGKLAVWLLEKIKE